MKGRQRGGTNWMALASVAPLCSCAAKRQAERWQGRGEGYWVAGRGPEKGVVPIT